MENNWSNGTGSLDMRDMHWAGSLHQEMKGRRTRRSIWRKRTGASLPWGPGWWRSFGALTQLERWEASWGGRWSDRSLSDHLSVNEEKQPWVSGWFLEHIFDGWDYFGAFLMSHHILSHLVFLYTQSYCNTSYPPGSDIQSWLNLGTVNLLSLSSHARIWYCPMFWCQRDIDVQSHQSPSLGITAPRAPIRTGTSLGCRHQSVWGCLWAWR